jgi:ubiquinone/menaquinone biosynthesis C-methylase UbiE
MKKPLINNEETWSVKWEEYFDRYQKDLRHAFYIRSLLKPKGKFLEIGAGSFRDCNLLYSRGYDIYGVDFCASTVEKAKKKFSLMRERILQMDAFNLSFDDNFFNTSYHNGFFVLFNDNEIDKLLKEQYRVSSEFIICTVHNSHNKDFVRYFENLSSRDSLYNIRFFEKDEIVSLMNPYCSEVKVLPVGKQKKYKEDFLINKGITHPLILGNYLKHLNKKDIQNSEKLLCIGKIKKK